jgi:hypothetical protein
MNIAELTRTDRVDELVLDKEHPFHGNLDIISFLKRVRPLETMPSEDHMDLRIPGNFCFGAVPIGF